MDYTIDRDRQDDSGKVTISVKDFLRLYELEKSINGVDLEKDIIYIPVTNYNYPCKILNATEGERNLKETISRINSELEKTKPLALKYNALKSKWWFKFLPL